MASDEELEYPPELDEYLQTCVTEFDGDFDAISREFLEIASGLEEPLVSRAQEAFSPEGLRQRWRKLFREATGMDPGMFEGQQSPAPEAAAAPAPADAPAAAPQPDSVKDQLDESYVFLQSELPQHVEDVDSEWGSTSDGMIGHAWGKKVGGEGADSACDTVAASTALIEEGDEALPIPPGVDFVKLLSAATGSGGQPGAFTTNSAIAAFATQMQQAAMSAGGEASMLEKPGLPTHADLSHIMPHLAAKSGQCVPSFDDVLMACGVDPDDIEGPLKEPPAHIKSLFDGMSGSPDAEDTEAAVKVGTSAVVKASGSFGQDTAQTERWQPGPQPKQQQRQPQPQQQQPKQEQEEEEEEEDPEEQRRRFAQLMEQQQRLHALEAPSDSEEGGSDSADEEFAQLRRSIKKNASQEMASTQDGPPAMPRPAVATKRLPVSNGSRSATPSSASKHFVKLEIESDGSDDDESTDGKPASDGDVSEDSLDAECQDAESIKVISRLLLKAPTGECPWDMWLDATRTWPWLQVRLGTPDFQRRDDGGLKVQFSVDDAKALLEEERRKQEEERAEEADRAARMKERVADFVKDVEQRRARVGGGFVLTSSCPELEEYYKRQDREQQARAEQEEQAEQKRKEAEEEKRRRIERERLKQEEEAEKRKEAERMRAEEQARLLQQRAEEERAAQQLAGEEARREEALASIAASMSRRRAPLYDPSLSFGVPVPSLSPFLEQQLASGGTETLPWGTYLLPWGTPGLALSAPSEAQRQVLATIHAQGLAEAVLLLPSNALQAAGAPECVCSHAAGVLMLLRQDILSAQAEHALPCGERLGAVLVGPIEGSPLPQLFTQPLALWAFEAGEESDSPSGRHVRTSDVSTVCVPLRRPRPGSASGGAVCQDWLAALLSEVYDEGLAVAGLRLVHPRQSPQGAPVSTALLQTAKPDEALLMVCLRGPSALDIWRTIIGPADPELARRTDPASLNARFGGDGRSGAVAPLPPSSTAKAYMDVIWAFGGRLDAETLQVPEDAQHAMLVDAPRRYAVKVCGRPSFAQAGALLSGLALRAGRLISVCAEGSASGEMVVTAQREGGDAFITSCRRLLCAPLDSPPDVVLTATAVAAESLDPGAEQGETCVEPCRVLPGFGSQLGFANSTVLPLPTALAAGDPEVLIVGLKPRAVNPHALLAFCNGIYAHLVTGGKDKQAQAHPIFSVGAGVDLLAARLVDLQFCLAQAESSGRGGELRVLQQFHSFAQVLGRTPAHEDEPWYLDGAGPAAFLCLRGAGVVERFRHFMAKEWTFKAATSGDVRLSPNSDVACQAYRVLFGDLPAPMFAATVPSTDLRSDLRFQPEAGAAVVLREASLFPRRLAPQLTVAAVLPPTTHKSLWKIFAEIEQKGFQIAAAFMSGGFPERIARFLFDQEVSDKNLEEEDWAAFCDSVGCSGEGEDDEDSSFKCIWLVLARHQAVKGLAQLCGHGDPAVNSRHLRASVRCGRDRVANGLRCPTSFASAQGLLQLLRRELHPCLAPPTAQTDECSLGVEDSCKNIQCTLVAVAVRQQGVSVAHVLRHFYWALSEQGWQCVGLRVVGGSPEYPTTTDLPLGAAAAATAERLRLWKEARPAAEGAVQLALEEQPLILMAWEGATGIGRLRQGMQAVASELPRGSIAHYTSASTSEAAVDITHFFHDLFAAKHYIVRP